MDRDRSGSGSDTIKVHNYKVSFKFQSMCAIRQRVERVLESPDIKIKAGIVGQTFKVIQFPHCPYSFTLFFRGHVNVTGLSRIKDIQRAYTIVFSKLRSAAPCICMYTRDAVVFERGEPRENVFGLLPTDCDGILSAYTVDNICATADLKVRLNLKQLCLEAGKSEDIQYARFNIERFPGCNIRFACGHGSILVFTTGKLVFVGSKSEQDIYRLLKLVLRLLQKRKNIVLQQL